MGIRVAAYLAGAAIGPIVLTTGERVAGDMVYLALGGLLGIAAVIQPTLGRYTARR